MAVSFRFAVQTDLGTVRTNNEDSALGSPRLLVLADGMGGHAAGEVASAIALRVFSELDHTPGVDISTQIAHAGRSARRALQEMSDADPMLESMGTTLVTVVSDGEQVRVGHIGDSRVYALRGAYLSQVTTDHTHVQRLVDQGQLSPERARTHPYRAMLLRSLDDQPGGPDLDVIDLDVAPGDRLLLCSDGLSDYLSPEHIGEVLAIPDRDAAAQGLVEAALAVGTRDNVTVVVADVVEEPDGDPHVLLAPPVFAGAVADGVALSSDAATALHLALPEVLIDPAAPWAGTRLTTPHPGPPVQPDTGESELLDLPGESTAGPSTGTPGTGTPGTAPSPTTVPSPTTAPAEPSAARRGAPDLTDASSAAALDLPPLPAQHGRPPRLPGLLAGAAVLLLAIALWAVLG